MQMKQKYQITVFSEHTDAFGQPIQIANFWNLKKNFLIINICAGLDELK